MIVLKTIFFLVTILSVENCFSQGTVKLKMTGINVFKGGVLSAALFDEKNFLKSGKQLVAKKTEANLEEVEMMFENIPAGQYAIAVFQDIDRNNKLKTNLIGFPIEPIGFSNNVCIRFRAPTFKDARITVEDNKMLNLIIKVY